MVKKHCVLPQFTLNSPLANMNPTKHGTKTTKDIK